MATVQAKNGLRGCKRISVVRIFSNFLIIWDANPKENLHPPDKQFNFSMNN